MNMCFFMSWIAYFLVLNSVLFLIYIRKRSSLADIYNYISSLLKKIQQNCDFMTGFCETYEETFRLPAGTS